MTVNFGRAANLIGSARQTVVGWASDGVLPIDHRSSVKSLDFCGLLCAAVIRDLRSRGMDLPAIRPITLRDVRPRGRLRAVRDYALELISPPRGLRATTACL